MNTRYNRFCLRMSVGAFLSVFLIIFIISLFNSKSLNQDYFTLNVVAAALLVSFFVAIAGVYKQNLIDRSIYGKLWPAFAILFGITYGFLGLIVGHVVSFLVVDVLKNIAFSPIGISSITSLLCGLLAYCAANGVFRLNMQKYLALETITVVIGMLTSIVMTRNQYWWKSSICALGMPSSKNYGYYDFTLILLGASLILFVSYLRPQIYSLLSKGILNDKKVRTLAMFYFIEMIAVALVGIIPYGVSKYMNEIHVFLGSFVFYDVSMVMLLSFWIFRSFSKKFLIENYILLLICSASYFIGFYSKLLPFATAEISMIIAVIVWIVLLINDLKKINDSSEVLTMQRDYSKIPIDESSVE